MHGSRLPLSVREWIDARVEEGLNAQAILSHIPVSEAVLDQIEEDVKLMLSPCKRNADDLLTPCSAICRTRMTIMSVRSQRRYCSIFGSTPITYDQESVGITPLVVDLQAQTVRLCKTPRHVARYSLRSVQTGSSKPGLSVCEA